MKFNTKQRSELYTQIHEVTTRERVKLSLANKEKKLSADDYDVAMFKLVDKIFRVVVGDEKL